MTAEEMWNRYVRETGIKNTGYEAWAFGEAPDELAALVVSGRKTATASAYPLYEREQEPLPGRGSTA